MDYTTRLDEDPAKVHVNYECPCGCTAGVMYVRYSGTVELGGCCCGRLLFVGEGAEQRVTAAFESGSRYDLDTNEVLLPWGETVVAVLAVPQGAEHGAHSIGVATVHDPVCHMDIDPNSAAGTSEYKGVTYYFCARGCKLDFDDDPEAVLKAEAEYDHASPVEHMMAGGVGGSVPARSDKKPWWMFW